MGWWWSRDPVVPVVRLTGVIGGGSALRSGLSLSSVARALEDAFAVKRAKAVALLINSPGGSPVQSRLIYKRVRALAEENGKKVYVFAEDVMASGGYLIALAGDEIYADDNSIVGSIGVISAGFGFEKAIEKLGVERRVYTSGESKMTLDPFQPEREEDIARLKAVQRDVHDSFIALVRERRGARLREPTAAGEAGLFSGAFWVGPRARELGLIDGLSDMRAKMRELYGDQVQLKVFGGQRGLLRRIGWPGSRLEGALPPLGGLLPAQWPEDVLATLEARALWSRFGL
jgi:signal peptide peptidase SppA